MITGFNTNVRYQGRLFHVQTEDSGRRNPHVISHLFHGGTILASEKREYGEKLASGDLDREVRAMMEAQHRAMLTRLRRGEFNDVIAERLGDSAEKPPEREARRGGADARNRVTAPEPVRPDPVSEAPAAAASPAFGEGVVSQKPLDELILEYLVEKARERAPGRPAEGARRPAPGSRTRG
jgi:hypothetical protein